MFITSVKSVNATETIQQHVHSVHHLSNLKCLFIQHCQDNSNCVHHPSLSLSLYLQNLHTSVIFEKGEDADHNLEKDYGMPPTPLRLEEQHRGEHSCVSSGSIWRQHVYNSVQNPGSQAT